MAYVVRTKKGKRKKLIQACYFSKNITLIMQSLFLPAQPRPTAKAETKLLRQLKLTMGYCSVDTYHK